MMINYELCNHCINGDGNGGCVAKQEAPYEFDCEENEMFEEYQ